MANNLEEITDDYYVDDEELQDYSINDSTSMDPILSKFTDGIKDEKRKKEMEEEISRLHKQYFQSLKSGAPGRAALLEHSYNLVPEDDEIQGKNPKEVLEERLYATPGRHYQYVNGVVGDKKKSKDIKGELGKAAGYAIKEGWPVLGAGAGWLLANNFYKKNIITDLKKRKGIFKRKKGFNPIKSIMGGGLQAGKYAFRGTTRPIWNLVKKPAAYAIGAYAVYKVISYLLKRKKEKKLEHQEVERLENLRNEMLAQKQMFYTPRQEMEQAA